MRSSSEGRMWRVLALLCVMVLVAAACGSDDGGEYPWVSQTQTTVGVPAALDSLTYGDHQRQVPCAECGSSSEGWDPDEGLVTFCPSDHPTLYYDNQIVVEGEFEPEGAEDVTPILEINGGVFEPPDYHLFQWPGAVDVLEVVELARAAGSDASPNYLFELSPGWKFGPADDRTQSGAPTITKPSDWSVGTIAVLDDFTLDPNDDTSGHGVFIENLLLALGHEVERVRLEFGSTVPNSVISSHEKDTWAVAAALASAATGDAEVISMSFGTYPCDGYPPILVKDQIALLRETHTLVAAAGNDSNGNPDPGPAFFPASEADVIGVGAVGWLPGTGWIPADFSNIAAGQVWSPGVAIVSELKTGPGDTPETWQWSGTSFAAPIYAACVAAGRC
ncbi:MAG: S8/S53 family peptidase [Acidimicrobiia bacterium]|nr:S8/S53 family peptidase [Acidimicrobiia bacterium]